MFEPAILLWSLHNLLAKFLGITLRFQFAQMQNAGMRSAEKRQDLVVFILRRPSSTCGECARELHKGSFIRLQGEKGALCLECADLDHLEFYFLLSLPHPPPLGVSMRMRSPASA